MPFKVLLGSCESMHEENSVKSSVYPKLQVIIFLGEGGGGGGLRYFCTGLFPFMAFHCIHFGVVEEKLSRCQKSAIVWSSVEHKLKLIFQKLNTHRLLVSQLRFRDVICNFSCLFALRYGSLKSQQRFENLEKVRKTGIKCVQTGAVLATINVEFHLKCALRQFLTLNRPGFCRLVW